MKYVFVLKESYHRTNFVFDDFEEGCKFIYTAMKNIKTDEEVEFSIYEMEEGEEDEE